MKHYEARLDNIFAKGSLWKHRTFRTVLDPYSSEYDKTTMEQKVSYLRKVVASGEELEQLVSDYKMRYIEQNRKDIANATDLAFLKITEYLLNKTS